MSDTKMIKITNTPAQAIEVLGNVSMQPIGVYGAPSFIRGEKGEDGYTPIKGVDYWTPEDLAPIEAAIANASAVAAGYVTPEAFGAVGDGVHDDAPALEAALKSGSPVQLTKDLYIFSDVLVIDHNVEMDGRGHTIYSNGGTLWFRAALKGSEGEVAIVHEHDGIGKRYSKGYYLYKGRKAVNEEYEDPDYQWFDIYSVKLRNFDMLCTNMSMKTALYLQRSCDCEIDSVRIINTEGYLGDGEMAFHLEGANIRVTRCHAEGWAKYQTWKQSDCGYGYGVYGDNITISNCSARNCKHCVMVGGFDNWASNIVIDNCNFYMVGENTRRPGGDWVYHEPVNTHAPAINLILSNLNIVIEKKPDVESTGFSFITIRNPGVVINNVSVNAGENVGTINFYEWADKIFITNLYAPTACLQTVSYSSNPLTEWAREVHLTSCVLNRLEHCKTPTKIFLENCTIRQFVDETQYLYANNCYFARDMDWPTKPTLTVYGETILSNCYITGHHERTISSKAVIIKAPENMLHLIHCKIEKRLDERYKLTNAESYEMHECRIEDAFGMRLDISAELDHDTLL